MQKSAANNSLEFTGERFIPTEQGRIRLEHMHRYAAVQQFIQNKIVLDVASGEGYGTALLAKSAKSVIGVDISHEAINHASQTYVEPNLKYLQGSATQLNFGDGLFDVVVSFETIEHLAEQEQMIAELARVLRPDGILIISSPNRPIYSEESGELNEFHVKELDFQELNDLLAEKFKSIRYFGQRIQMGSLINSLNETSSHLLVWSDNGQEINANVAPVKDPIYFLAICAKEKDVILPNFDASALYPDAADLVKHYVGFATWAKNQHAENQVLSQKLKDLDSTLKDLDSKLDARASEVRDLRRSLVNCNTVLESTKSELQASNLSLLKKVKRKLKRKLVKNDLGLTSSSPTSVNKKPWLILFDEKWYLDEYPDIAKSGVDPLDHFVESGIAEGRNPNAFFDVSWYLSKNSDVRTSGLDPLEHYWGYGAKEGRNPSTRFSSEKYLILNPDIKESGINPLEHYLLHGKAEGRLIHSSIGIESSADFELYRNKIIEFLKPYQNFYESIQSSKTYLIKALSEIQFQKEKNPLVSIIIPMYGKWEYTLQCLYSIYMNLPMNSAIEVIVIDDCSPDNSGEIISQVKGIHYVKNSCNLGFIGSCNYGASLAKGKYLYFLNNDTVITPSAIEELIGTFEIFPLAGLVGSKLIYPDGSLQEAGGIIWQDASGWNFGRNQNPCMPMYNYAREVDYCSGASIMIAREVFKGLGLFDDVYAPAYYEDVDLAFKVKEAGLRVIYQPLSRVIHFEGVSSGTDLTQGMKAYQVTNQQKFLKRWDHILKKFQLNSQEIDVAKDRACEYRILVVDAAMLTPNEDAGSLLIFNKMILFKELGFQVTFATNELLSPINKNIEDMQRVGIEVLYSPYFETLSDHLKICEDRYDIIMLVRPDVFESNIADINEYCPSAKIFFHTIDLHFIRMQREAAIKNNPELLKWAYAMKEKELNCIEMSDLTFVVSSEEKKILNEIDKSLNVQEFSLIIDVNPSQNPFVKRKDILFVGNFNHPPNLDAVYFFCSEVMPYLRQSNQNILFRIGGSNMPEEIKRLAADDILIEGFIQDLYQKCEEVKVMVAPLRYGAGVKGKVASSLSYGLPVVATKIAGEGMHLENNLNILIVDDPKEMACAILKVYNDERVWENLRHNGLLAANNLWGFSVCLQRLKEEVLQPLGFKLI
jgi:GT2 family glycosyltransferase/ubiquinone/menaquinone biosynthesis C-methylase UbiE/glycosyltransferase involved in cell wall biosynthesis